VDKQNRIVVEGCDKQKWGMWRQKFGPFVRLNLTRVKELSSQRKKSEEKLARPEQNKKTLHTIITMKNQKNYRPIKKKKINSKKSLWRCCASSALCFSK